MESLNIKEEKVEAKVVKKKSFTPLKFFFLLITLLVIGTLGYFCYSFYQKDVNSKGEIAKTNSEKDDLTDQLKTVNDQLTTTKSDLENKSKIVDVRTVVSGTAKTFTYLSKCGVGVSVPDASQTFEPTDDNPWSNGARTWRISYHKIVSSEEYTKSPFIGGDQYFATLVNDTEGSGYIAGLVSIKCAKNANNLTADVFVKSYLDSVKNWSKKEAKAAGETYDISNVKDLGIQNIWGLDTKKVSVKGFSLADAYKENGNLFISGGNLYYVFYTSASTNSKSLASMKGIFNSLVVFNR